MRIHRMFLAGASICVLSFTSAFAVPVTISDTAAETTIIAYQGSTSFIYETHGVSLKDGMQIINITNLPNSISPESIMLDLPANIKLNTYSYAPSDVTPYGLLAKLVGQNIGWATLNPVTGKETVSQGKLISATNGIVMKFPDGIELDPPGRPVISNWPENAMLGNGVRLDVNSTPGKAVVSLGYLAGGLDWQASYIIMLRNEEANASLRGLMSLNNQTGSDFKQAKIRLVAGNINMEQAQPMMRGAEMAMAFAQKADGISENVAFDTHIYQLDGQHNIANTSILAVPFIESADLQIRKLYMLENYVYGNPEPENETGQFSTPEIRFSLKNDTAAGLGIALPGGTVRVMAMQDGSPMLLGEDRIAHIPVGEQINLRTGRAFDITAKRRQTSFTAGSENGNFEAAYELTLSNNKSTGVVVDLVEHLPGQWKITKESMRHIKRDPATAIWSVPVPANGNVTLSYSMKTRR